MLRKILWVLLWTSPCWARLGGGEGYSAPSHSSSSSGHSYSSGSGGGEAELIFFLLRLCIEFPALGIPLVIGVVLFFVYQSRQPYYRPHEVSHQVDVPDSDIFHLQPKADVNPDPNFSYYVFRDFVGRLYGQVQRQRCRDLRQVGHYLTPQVSAQLLRLTRNQEVSEVRDVLVGAARILSQVSVQRQIRLTLTLETNFTEVTPQAARRIYSKERWTFVREAGVRSPGPLPVATERLGCPNCGQSGEVGSDGICPFCDRQVNRGNYGWVVANIQVMERQTQPPMSLGGYAPERGTELPTQRNPMLAQRFRSFCARYPDFSDVEFKQRVTDSFVALQEAWSSQQWELARPYQSDSLFETHRYYIEAYQAQGLVNRLSQIEVGRIDLCNVDTDPYFDAITVRIFASMIDITEDTQGKRVGGDPKKPRHFSEYWTFIRKVGHQKTAHRSGCPSCGAPLDRVNQAGNCEYCGSHITSGDFDWVLAQIEQDESYRATRNSS